MTTKPTFSIIHLMISSAQHKQVHVTTRHANRRRCLRHPLVCSTKVGIGPSQGLLSDSPSLPPYVGPDIGFSDFQLLPPSSLSPRPAVSRISRVQLKLDGASDRRGTALENLHFSAFIGAVIMNPGHCRVSWHAESEYGDCGPVIIFSAWKTCVRARYCHGWTPTAKRKPSIDPDVSVLIKRLAETHTLGYRPMSYTHGHCDRFPHCTHHPSLLNDESSLR
ncbi:hypothetical protein GE21DRAFT_1285997, partial [Neurospora crassa]